MKAQSSHERGSVVHVKILATQVGTFQTTGAVADAVLAYWLTLTEDNRSDVVEVPYVTETGTCSRASITLSPATGLATLDAAAVAPGAVLDDASALVDLRSRIRAAHLPAQGMSCQPPPSALLWDEF